MIRYIGYQLEEPAKISYSSSELLIIPELGNEQLYYVEDDGNGNYPIEQDVRMILTTNLYTHIIVSPDLVTGSDPQLEQNCYAIADLDRDPDNQNIVLVPLPVVADYSKFYIYLANYQDNRYHYFDNIPAIVYLMKYDYAPAIVGQTEHFTYINNTDFECIFFEREEEAGFE